MTEKKTEKKTMSSSPSDDHELRNFSAQVVSGVERAPSRSMLRAVGFGDDDFRKPQIGIASTWSMVTPVQYAHR